MYTEKIPPQDVDAEEAVLGSLLIDGGAISKVAPFLKPTHFAHERNNWCYQACLSLSDRSEAIDQVTVARELERIGHMEGVGGRTYLAHLAAVVPTSVHVVHYGRIVYRTAMLRELIRAAGQIADIGYQDTPDVDSALSRAEDILYKLRLGQSTRDFTHIKDVIDQYLSEVAVPPDAKDEQQRSVPTGFIDLDRLLGGLQRSDLVILA
ncbi:MAG: DnaB-like helicase N-terminal domain-containing protein, partial [Chloroflexota bacterium]